MKFKAKILPIIKKQRKKGTRHAEIASILNASGFKTSRGLDWHEKNVANLVYKAKRRIKPQVKPKKATKKTVKPKKDPDLVKFVLNSTTLTDAQKIILLKTLI